MNFQKRFAMLIALAILSTQVGCKGSTSPNNNSSSNGAASGEFVFSEGLAQIETAMASGNASTAVFRGDNPSSTKDGRVIYDVWGDYTPDGMDHIVVSNSDGSSAQTIVNMEEVNSEIYTNPKMSPDGKYVCFNYDDYLQSKLGTTYGTLIYSSSGTALYVVDGVWDATWAPDGSIVAAGTVYSSGYDGDHTYKTAGLFRIAKDFSATTVIGSGLTTPEEPSVSPDGSKIAFSMNNHIWTINADGTGTPKQITTGPNIETFSCWSPDGSLIAAVSNGDIGLTSGNGLAVVSSNPATPTTVSQSASVWLQNKNSTVGIVQPIGNVSWK